MSNVIAGVVRGQLPYLETHIAQKRAIYERYQAGLAGLPVSMNPYDLWNSVPNFWLSCLLIEPSAMCKQVRDDHKALYIPEQSKSCPTEILETLASFNAEGRPIWKPLHTQPFYRNHAFITREGAGRGRTNAYIEGGMRGSDGKMLDIGYDIFNRGLCLPSDNKMTESEQDQIIEIVRACFE
jgi:dTDP-4-amino-4,6-dideoxygalactose transaminase